MCRTDQIAIYSNNGEVSYLNTKGPLGQMTVLELKKYVVKTFPRSGGETLRLIFADKHLERDTKLLSEYGVQYMSVIQLVPKVPGGGGGSPRPPYTDDGLGDKGSETRQSAMI